MLSLVCVAAAVAGLAWHEWPGGGQPLFNGLRSLQPGSTVGEQLVPTQPGLHRVDVALTCRGPAAGQVILRITADPDGRNELARAAAPAGYIEQVSQPMRRPYTFVAFSFEPLREVAGIPIWLWVKSEADQPLGIRYLKDPSPTAKGGLREGESEASNATITRGHLTLRLYYRRSVIENLALFVERLTRERPGLLGDSRLYVSLLILYAGLVGALLVR